MTMVRNRLNLLYLVILGSIVASLPVMEAYSATQALKINEVEVNPAGTVSGNQWLEVHNRSGELLNIGGWLVKSTNVGKTFSIPEGFVIPPNDYLVVPFNSVMFSTDNDSIVLLTADSVEVDRTPVLTDADGDDRTWQRFPNGVDTDSESDWVFKNSTIGRSNGLPAVRLNFTLSVPIFIDQLGNKVEAFSAGQMAGIKSEIVNRFGEERSFAYIVQIKDEEGFTVFLSWVEDLTILPNRTIKPAIFWLAEERGSLLVETFIWRSLNSPEVLTPSQSGLLRIAG
ncbi:MAG: lamin tail domain-containing protein [Nitrososphaerales archaeon]